jgi:hypothetical protein
LELSLLVTLQYNNIQTAVNGRGMTAEANNIAQNVQAYQQNLSAELALCHASTSM